MRADKSTVFTFIRWAAIVLLTPIFLFVMAGWIGSSIPRNSGWIEPASTDERVVEILVGSNGIHTEIAMPIITPEMDWTATFPASDIKAAYRPYTHVAVSWGERQFFQETPTWWDVNPITVLGAMTGGEGLLHVAHYVRPAPSHDYRVLRLRASEYRALTQVIERQLAPAQSRETLPGYDRHDVFYTARGTYNLGNTCNQWTSDQLAAAGVKTGQWTPFSGGVLKWVPTLRD